MGGVGDEGLARAGVQVVGGADLRMVSEIGAARTKLLTMTGRRFGPVEAESWGLVQQVVEPDELEPVGAPEAPRPRPMLDDDFPWVWVLASAAVLGCAGIALLLAVLVAGGAL